MDRLLKLAEQFASEVNATVTIEWTTKAKAERLKLTIVSDEDSSLKNVQRFRSPHDAVDFLRDFMRPT
jgi:hypothetical protein